MKANDALLRRCAEKMLQCPAKLKQDTVCIHSLGTTHHPDRISLGCAPQRFSWSRSCRREDSTLYFIAAENAESAPFWDWCGCKILFNLEPPDIVPAMRPLMDKYYDAADIILSSVAMPPSYDKGGKVVPFIYGSTWISDEERRVYPKSRNISIIASDKRAAGGHILRHSVIETYASKYSIDIYGRGYNPVDRKVEALRDYRFSLIIENTREQFWVTEKLIDAFLTGTIPIYWGAPVVREIFDVDGILFFNDIDDLEGVLRMATAEEYDRRRSAVLQNYELALQFSCPEERLQSDIFGPLYKLATS